MRLQTLKSDVCGIYLSVFYRMVTFFLSKMAIDSFNKDLFEQLLPVGHWVLGVRGKHVNQVWSCLWAWVCWLVKNRNTLGTPWPSSG